MKKLIIILAIACLYWACDSVDDTLILKNQSQKDLYYLVLNDGLTAAYSPNANQSYEGSVQKLSSKSTMNEIRPGPRGKAWKGYAKASKDGFLHIFLFNLDTLKAYNWQEVVYQKKYEKELKFTYMQLEQMNWILPINVW